ncbi:hypothetical protein CWO92_15800 [Heyndrickxia camelliae]|uniref:Uncharacterized protein n=1 Tax=Heyndrickxia camelliae TaxID=1707093 RepID=A0A2N3LHD1_9BACI|nr:hypothetical protein CWO92_15800 [Heyndrickxia camelliae]
MRETRAEEFPIKMERDVLYLSKLFFRNSRKIVDINSSFLNNIIENESQFHSMMNAILQNSFF